MSQVTNYIYLGSKTEAQDVEWLAANNIKIVINVARDLSHLEYPPGIQVIKIAIDDEADPSIDIYLDRIADYIQNATVHYNKKVLVHCVAGISRSATFVAYYLMKYYMLTLPEALALIRQVRPRAKPNMYFMELLQTRAGQL